MAGVSRDKKREKEAPAVELTTPHGAEITVGAKRAKSLLERPPVRFGDGVMRKYVRSGEDNEVEAQPTKALPPRTGTKANTGSDE